MVNHLVEVMIGVSSRTTTTTVSVQSFYRQTKKIIMPKRKFVESETDTENMENAKVVEDSKLNERRVRLLKGIL